MFFIGAKQIQDGALLLSFEEKTTLSIFFVILSSSHVNHPLP